MFMRCQFRESSRFKPTTLRIITIAGGGGVMGEVGLLKKKYIGKGKPGSLIMYRAIFPVADFKFKDAKAWAAAHTEPTPMTGKKISPALREEIEKDFDRTEPPAVENEP